jgi:hypothetical protein
MKTIIPLCALVLTLSIFGCRQDQFSLAAPVAKNSADNFTVPDPELVPYTRIPYPFPNTLYRIVGAALADGPVVILKRVLDGGFRLRRAWHPQISLCAAPFLDELIIELEDPEDAIYELGFTSDFRGTIGSCASHWNEYNFVEEGREPSN